MAEENKMEDKTSKLVIIGAGMAGLSATLYLAEQNCRVLLVSNMPSERSGSCMAEGGINAALDTRGEGDSPELHFEETMQNAAGIADSVAIREMTNAAPSLIRELHQKGVPFHLTEDGEIDVRSFGGQTRKRTVYAKDTTGKQIMSVLIDAVRKYECSGQIQRYAHHSFAGLLKTGEENRAVGCQILDTYTDQYMSLQADAVLIASGGMHGIFGNTTGAKNDTGAVTAELFMEGVRLSNLEFIQYHPTTAENGLKRLLITEAARGEGGRLCVLKNGQPIWFMEEKYPELKNLMPRDVTAREIYEQMQNGNQVWIDFVSVPEETFQTKLAGLREDCQTFIGKDPLKERIPVEPGIHYFMGGIQVDRKHRTSMAGLYAAGECACIYHGANRLGGNSLLGAIYGGKKAAETMLADLRESAASENRNGESYFYQTIDSAPDSSYQTPKAAEHIAIQKILRNAAGVVTCREKLEEGLSKLQEYHSAEAHLAEAILTSALFRKESRGAFFRTDYPCRDSAYEGASTVQFVNGEIKIEIQTFDQTTEIG